jgi:hypothetical protein
VLFILTVCAVSAALSGIYKLQPAASASTSRETTLARRALETSALAPPSTTIVLVTIKAHERISNTGTFRIAP